MPSIPVQRRRLLLSNDRSRVLKGLLPATVNSREFQNTVIKPRSAEKPAYVDLVVFQDRSFEISTA